MRAYTKRGGGRSIVVEREEEVEVRKGGGERGRNVVIFTFDLYLNVFMY